MQHKLVPVLTPLGLPARATDTSAFTLVARIFVSFNICRELHPLLIFWKTYRK